MESTGSLRLCLLNEAKETHLLSLAHFGSLCSRSRIKTNTRILTDLHARIAALRAGLDTGFPEPTLDTLRDIGIDLFRLIFHDDVLDLYKAMKALRADIVPIELLIEDAQLASWPWEFMFDREDGTFICQGKNPITRCTFSDEPLGDANIKDSQIRMLVFIGVPPHEKLISPAEQKASIINVFNSNLTSKKVDLCVEQGRSRAELLHALQKQQYHIFHFYGHAGYDRRSKQGYLELKGPKSEERLDADDVARILTFRGIRLVFLNACETAVGSMVAQSASSVAGALFARGIPAVLATQFTMPDNSAHAFASHVYNSLAYGHSFESSVREGRIGINSSLKARFDWGIPVLFARRSDMRVFKGATR